MSDSRDFLTILIWLIIFLVLVYLSSYVYDDDVVHIGLGQPTQEEHHHRETEIPGEFDTVEDFGYLYDEEQQPKSAPCGKKLMDMYDEKVDNLSNYDELKKTTMELGDAKNLSGHIGSIINTDTWSYAKEKELSGGPIYKYKGAQDIFAYDNSMGAECAL